MAARPQAERPLLQAVKYLLDTCIIEALLKEEAGHDKVRTRIAAAPRGSLAISALTTVEIWTGITGAREPRAKRIAFEAWLKVMRVAPFDADAARQAFVNRPTDWAYRPHDRRAGHRHGCGVRNRQSTSLPTDSWFDDRKLVASSLSDPRSRTQGPLASLMPHLNVLDLPASHERLPLANE